MESTPMGNPDPADLDDAGQRSTWRESLRRCQSLVPLEWDIDPTESALEGSTWRVQLPGAFCVELGRRILLAQLEFSEWILRRVERVAFERDRSVSREIDIDLLVRPDAPVFVDSTGDRHWLVPLSMMHRRTLVNFHLADEGGTRLTTPGLRLTQQFDQSVLLAAAAAASERLQYHHEVRAFVQGFVAGDRNTFRDRADQLVSRTSLPRPIAQLADDALFMFTANRFLKSFTLFVFLPVRLGRHRLLRMSFDEPTNWRYQQPMLQERSDGDWVYVPGTRPRSNRVAQSLAAFALRPTRLRFQVPGAEHSASYHFEVTAPRGVRIVEASLLAGRPNQTDHRVSVDHIVGHSPTVGLHAVEIPNGSLCRVQLDMAVPTRGWLTTLLVASWLVFAVIASVVDHRFADWRADQVTHVVVILITTSAGVAALLSSREFGGVTARLVARTRALGTVQMALPAFAAGALAYGGTKRYWGATAEAIWLVGLFAASAVIVIMITYSWIHSLVVERRDILLSPWDMTSSDATTSSDRRVRDLPGTFQELLKRYSFDRPAIGIRSAEAWHEVYAWSDRKQYQAVSALRNGRASHGAETCQTHGRPLSGADGPT